MSHHRSDVIEHALEVLDRHGLADLSMRRLAADLGVQPSALYWHFANKQALLAAVADEVLRRGARPVPDGPWDERVTAFAHQLRDAMLAYRDGAELVSTTLAFGLGEEDPVGQLVELLDGTGNPGLTRMRASTLLHFVLGHTFDEQAHLQADSVGALDAAGPSAPALDERRGMAFVQGLGIITDGILFRAGTVGQPP